LSYQILLGLNEFKNIVEWQYQIPWCFNTRNNEYFHNIGTKLSRYLNSRKSRAFYRGNKLPRYF